MQIYNSTNFVETPNFINIYRYNYNAYNFKGHDDLVK